MSSRVIHALMLIWLPALTCGSAGESGDRWLLMVRTVNTDAAREAEFNRWYDDVDVPDVLKVPGFERARRGALLAADPAEKSKAEAGGRYVALYDIHTPAIDKTIIDMLMATWKMISLGRDSPLLKVEERTYYGRISPTFTGVGTGTAAHPVVASLPPAGGAADFAADTPISRAAAGVHSSPAADTCLVLERFGARPDSDIGRLERWYQNAFTQTTSQVPGVLRATRYELYRVLMFEPTSAPRFMTVFEVRCASLDEARITAEQITRRHEHDGEPAGYSHAQTLTYRLVGDRAGAVDGGQARGADH